MTSKRINNHYERFRLQNSEQRFILILGDIIAGTLALILALYICLVLTRWILPRSFLEPELIPGFTCCH